MRVLLGGKTDDVRVLIGGVKIKYPNRISKLTKNFFYLRLNFSYKRFCFDCVGRCAESLWNNVMNLKSCVVSKGRNFVCGGEGCSQV